MAGVVIDSWNQPAIHDWVAAKVVRGMDAAGAHVAGRARARVKVRTGLVKANIDHEVRAFGDEVVCWVGVRRKGRGNRDPFYAHWLEMGSRTRAAHPFLRPALWESQHEILRMIEGA